MSENMSEKAPTFGGDESRNFTNMVLKSVPAGSGINACGGTSGGIPDS